jgi:hypothetical protein
MKQEVMKEVYKIPRIVIRGIVLEGGIIAVSSRIAVNGDVQYVDYDNDVEVMTTTAGKDIVVF